MLTGLCSVQCAHLFDEVPARARDVTLDRRRRLVGILRLDVFDEFAVLADDGGPARQREVEAAADGAQHLAVFPP